MRSGVLILAGPTASGKSALAVELAEQFGAEIVNADSRQIYRGMDIGTAAPPGEARRRVAHHLYGFLDPYERYSAARYTQDAAAAIRSIHARGKRAIVVGGTGFYIRALTGAVDLAAAHDEGLRARLASEARIHDTAFLYEWLALLDARRAHAIAPNDAYRILRALEVALARSPAAVAERTLPTLPEQRTPFLKVFLDVPWDDLERRIARRVDQMLASGLVEEAERIGAGAVAADAVGYPQALAYLAGACTSDELRRLLVRATRRYAKRQLSWFRREPAVIHLEPAAVASAAREKLRWV